LSLLGKKNILRYVNLSEAHSPQAGWQAARRPATTPRRPAKYVGSEIFRRAAFGDHHPLKIVRHAAVLDIVRALDWLGADEFVACEPATLGELERFHNPAYLEALQYADSEGLATPQARRRFCIGTLENPVFPGLFERAATTVGGSIAAAGLALDGQVAFHPSGGTHHGRRDHASGFCYLNDPVFAILRLLDGGCDRVVYVDLDAHHGDGVEAAFDAEPRVRTISIHEADRWPYSGAAGEGRQHDAWNFPVPRGCNDTELEFLVDHAVLPLIEDFDADALVVCCGADCLAGDPLSGMMLSNVALWDTVDRLLAYRLPSVILGGGGYNPWTVARYWAGMWGRISGQEIPQTLPEAAMRVLRDMECDLVDDDEIDEAWLTTIADSPYPGSVRDAVESLLTGLSLQQRNEDGMA